MKRSFLSEVLTMPARLLLLFDSAMVRGKQAP
jgi:hypothetical protein